MDDDWGWNDGDAKVETRPAPAQNREFELRSFESMLWELNEYNELEQT
jgi:hypothetical protein